MTPVGGSPRGAGRPAASRARRRSVLRAALALVIVVGTTAPAAAQTRIYTVGGTGLAVSDGDGEVANLAGFNYPRGLTTLPDGGFLVTEAYGNRVRRVLPDGRVVPFAGTGAGVFGGDGGPATAARLKMPHGTAALADGSYAIADTNNFRIRRVAPDGTITTMAGTGVRGFSGDGGAATAAKISAPRGIAAIPSGGLLIADSDNNRIRKVSPAGVITTVAGSGSRGFAGDGEAATTARLNSPYSVSARADGTIFVADTFNHRIRRIAPSGTITTVAGDGTDGYAGDGGPASAARLSLPHAVEALPDGRLLIADMGNHVVREVDTSGTITTIAGTGLPGFTGEALAPWDARFVNAKAAVPFGSGLLIADSGNNRVRYVGDEPWPAPAPGSGIVFINGAATYATSAAVTVAAPAAGAVRARVSNSAATVDGALASGVTYDGSDPVPWDLADAQTGGSPADGVRRVYAQWWDGTAWSPVRADSIMLDRAAPTVSTPVPAFVKNTSLGIGTVPMRLAWTGRDATSGVAGYDVSSSVDSVTQPERTTTSPLLDLALQPGSTYAYAVTGRDRAGNAAAARAAAPFSVALRQESHSSVAYAGAWSPATAADASGGATMSSSAAGATATLTFTGRSIALVAPVGAGFGTAGVRIDMGSASTVNLGSATAARRLVRVAKFGKSGPHTLTVTVSSGRVDVDAFVVGS